MKTLYGIETVDEFTQGENAPVTYKDFKKYVREMVREYHMSGMNVYTSSRSTKEWRKSN